MPNAVHAGALPGQVPRRDAHGAGGLRASAYIQAPVI
jgi:hypothetical protein